MLHPKQWLKSLFFLLVLCASISYGGSEVVYGAPPPPEADFEPLYTACSGERIDAVDYIDTDTTWASSGSPFYIGKHIEVMPGATLTIEPGVEMWIGYKRYVHVCSGASIIAKGTPDQHIVFTRNTPDSGPRWNKVWFHTNSTSYFRYTDFSYAGASASGDDAILHYEGPGRHVLNNCTIRASKQQGIVASGSDLNLTVAGTTFQDNGRRSMMIDDGANVSITGSAFNDVQDASIYLRTRPKAPTISVRESNLASGAVLNTMSNDVCMDAQENWWGADNGPSDGSTASDACGIGSNSGSGSYVSDGVDYRNWRTSEVPVAGITTPPTVTLTVTPDPTSIQPPGTEYTFDASGSTDMEDYAESLEVCWDWDNDDICETSWTTEKVAKHTFENVTSNQTVRLVVRDTDGLTSEVTQEVVLNIPPTAVFTYTHPTWAQVEFDASGSTDVEDAVSELEIAWDYEGDGTLNTSYTVSKTATYSYPRQGRYWPTLYVKDTTDQVGTQRQAVDIVPPVASNLLTNTTNTLLSSDGTITVEVPVGVGGVFTNGAIITHTPQLTPIHSGLEGVWLYQGFTLDAYSVSDTHSVDEISGTYTITISYDEGYFADVLGAPFEEELTLYHWVADDALWTPVASTTLEMSSDRLMASPSFFGDFALVSDIQRIYLPLISRSG